MTHSVLACDAHSKPSDKHTKPVGKLVNDLACALQEMAVSLCNGTTAQSNLEFANQVLKGGSAAETAVAGLLYAQTELSCFEGSEILNIISPPMSCKLLCAAVKQCTHFTLIGLALDKLSLESHHVYHRFHATVSKVSYCHNSTRFCFMVAMPSSPPCMVRSGPGPCVQQHRGQHDLLLY